MSVHDIPTTRAELWTKPTSPNDRFCHVSPNQIAAVFSFAQNSVLRTAFSLIATSLLEHGVEVRHPLLPDADGDRDWFSSAWSEFAEEVLHNFWIYGFVICVADADPVHVSRPRVVPIDGVDVEIRYDDYGRRAYRVSSKLAPGSYSAPSQRILSDVLVYEMQPPDRWGNLTSKIASLFADWALVAHVTDSFTLGSRQRALPDIMLECKEVTFDQKNIRTAESAPAPGVLSSIPRDLGEMEYLAQQRVAHIAQMVNQGKSPEAVYSTDVRVVTAANGQVVKYLPLDKRLVANTPADVPPEFDALRRDFVYRVGALFHVPVAALFNESGVTAGRAAAGENTVQMTVFEQQKFRLVSLLTPLMRDMFICARASSLAALSTSMAGIHAPRERKREALRQALARVRVTLPACPAPADALQLYALGMYKWKALRSAMSRTMHIALEDLHEEPELDQIQSSSAALGFAPQEPKPPPAAAGAVKKKARTK